MFYFNMRNAIATLCQQFEMEEPVIVETTRFHVDCREIILISAHHLIYSKNKKHNKTALIHTVNTQTGQTQLTNILHHVTRSRLRTPNTEVHNIIQKCTSFYQ